MKLHVLGAGCDKCNRLAESTRAAATELGLDFELEKITDMLRYAEFGVMVTPALVIDGKVAVTGRVPSVGELKTMLNAG